MTTDFNLAAQGFLVEDNGVYACNGVGFKNLLNAGTRWLEAHVAVVNQLNVFPVPDGDTGSNMLLTMRAALREAAQSGDHAVGAIAAAAAHGALLGARGNSGVILSQFLQGVAAGLKDMVVFTAANLAQAAQLGVAQAYQSVQTPVEGTILTVARAAADAATSDRDLVSQLAQMVAAAKVAQASTPHLLPALKEAGVTDSGGQGLLYILEGWLRFVYNQPVEGAAETEDWPLPVVGPGEYGYEVQFLIKGDGLNVPQIRARVAQLGWSTVVVGHAQVVKVHLHTLDPGGPLSYAVTLGTLGDIVVENLTEQAQHFLADADAVETAVSAVVVAPGPGFEAIFQSLGAAQVVAGWPTLPSTHELLAAIHQVATQNVLIFPNNGNIILAAQQAGELAAKNVWVAPTHTAPQGVAALVAFNPELTAEANLVQVAAAAQKIVTIEITRAARAAQLNGRAIQPGEMIGLVDNRLAGVGPSANQVAQDILAQLALAEFELLTIYFGETCPPQHAAELAASLKLAHPAFEVEVYNGGQPHYEYILSLE